MKTSNYHLKHSKMSKPKGIFLIFGLLIMNNVVLLEQSLDQKIDNIVTPLLQEYPGVQIAIGQNDRITFQKSYGISDLSKKARLTNDELFRIYSISKFITTIALLQQVEKGAINPDKPIVDYIPSWDESKINPWNTKITPLHLATHRSGIRHYTGLDEVYSSQQCYEVDEAVSIFDRSYLLFEPGTKKAYSSWGYVLLSKLIEEVTGISYCEYTRKYIFEPTSLSNIVLYDREKILPEAHIYEKDKNGNYIDVSYVNPSCKFGAGGFISNAKDLVALGMAFYSEKLISQDMVQLAVAGDVTGQIFMIGGVSAGARSLLAIDMKTGRTIAILGNLRGAPFEDIVTELFNTQN